MAVKITFNGPDVIVPADAFSAMANVLFSDNNVTKLIKLSLGDKLKSAVGKQTTDEGQKAQQIQEALKELRNNSARMDPKTPIWFLNWFLDAFEGQKTEEAKAVFDKIAPTKEFKAVEKAAGDWRANQKTQAQAVASACAKVLPLFINSNGRGVVDLAKTLSKALNDTEELVNTQAQQTSTTPLPQLPQLPVLQQQRQTTPAVPAPAVPRAAISEALNLLSSLERLLENGILTEDDFQRYQQRFIGEAAVPAAPPTSPGNKIKEARAAVAKVIQDINNFGENLVSEVGSLQQLTTRLATTNKQLAEAASNPTRLDEQFLIGAILAGLGALVAWAAKKFVFAEGGSYWEGPGNKTPRYTTKTINDNLQSLAGASEAAYGPNKTLVNAKEQQVNLNAIGTAKKNAIAALEESRVAFASALQGLNAVVPKGGASVGSYLLEEAAQQTQVSALPSNRGTAAVVSGQDLSPDSQQAVARARAEAASRDAASAPQPVVTPTPLAVNQNLRAAQPESEQAKLLRTSVKNLREALEGLNSGKALPELISALNSWKVGGVA
ncbi:MAG: hypothetical protein E6R04_09425 [Spirochaetes bacterium]|nr:MAG: hypothetical protein E6R04_09425 [Spirochaetota bacterium]